MRAAASIRAAAGLLVVTCLLAACGGAGTRLANHMQRGRDYFAHDDFVHASVEFRNAMQIAPKDLQARMMSARAAEKLGQFREAAGLYQSAVDLAPQDLDARASLGRLYALGNAPDQALAAVAPGLVKAPNDPALLTVRALAHAQKGDWAGARTDCDDALAGKPDNDDAIALRAGIYQHDGDAGAALTLVQTAVAAKPASTDLHELLARLYASRNDLEGASRELRTLIGARPENFAYRQQLAVLFARAGRGDEAQSVLDQAVVALPKSAAAKIALVEFLATQKGAEAAERKLKAFIDAEPDNPDLRFVQADVQQRAGAWDAALASYREIVRRVGTGPAGLTARDKIAAIDFRQGRVDEAQRLIGEVLEKSPHDDDALALRGEIALSREDSASAIADLRAALRDQPGSAALHRVLASAYVVNGEGALAEGELRTAIERAPTDTGVRLDLAKLLVDSAKTRAAVELLAEGVRSAPADSALRIALFHACMADKDYAQARQVAEDLKVLLPKDGVGFYLAGLAAQSQSAWGEASSNLERALELQPRAQEPLAALVKMEFSRGNPTAGIARIQKALEREPKDVWYLDLLAEAYLSSGNQAQAMAAATRATTAAPASAEALRTLARVQVASGDTEHALSSYSAAIAALPDAAGLIAEDVALLERMGRIDDAIARYETLYKRSPRPLVANNLAMVLASFRTDRPSLDLARDLVAPMVNSANGSYLDTYGWVHFKRGEYADAVAALEKAAARSPDSREIHYHLAMAQLVLGKKDQARRNLESALAQAADFPGVDEARKALASLGGRAS